VFTYYVTQAHIILCESISYRFWQLHVASRQWHWPAEKIQSHDFIRMKLVWKSCIPLYSLSLTAVGSNLTHSDRLVSSSAYNDVVMKMSLCGSPISVAFVTWQVPKQEQWMMQYVHSID